MELFDVIPENFFSILSSKNKKLYVACLLQAFSVYEAGSILGTDRKTIVDDLTVFLDHHLSLCDSCLEEFPDDIDEPKSSKDFANLVLRRFEACGWIYIDITNEYVEILNFTDSAITIIEALISICPRSIDYYNDDDFYDPTYELINPNEYKGYIYTIYSLLNSETFDYAIMLEQVFRNTKMLIRSLRKMDSRIKDYINGVVETSEIKDLMSKLIDYNKEIYEPTYTKLKTSDNINKYRLNIVNKLEDLSLNKEAMETITLSYMYKFKNHDAALSRANRDIDEIIDVFNSLDEFISGIDYKNKTYINSTIGKIKFLLNEEDNIIGKLNGILKYVKNMNKLGKTDKAMNDIKSVVNINTVKGYSESSLYTPRGKYERANNNIIDLDRFDISGIDLDQILGKKSNYSKELVEDFLWSHMKTNELCASDFLNENSTFDDVVMCIYILLYSSENNIAVYKLSDTISNDNFSISNFKIVKEG